MTNDPARRRARAARFVRLVFWIALAWLIGWVWYLRRTLAPHPPHWPATLPLAAVIGISSWQCGLAGAAFYQRRERRLTTARWLGMSAAALGLLWGGMWVLNVTKNRYLPDLPIVRWYGSLGISLADLEVGLRYPQRTVGERVEMLHDASVIEPQRLVALMDAHISRLEADLQQSPRTKARWVRGPFLGRSNYQFLGFAASDWHSPPDGSSPELTNLDRHELAHFTINQYLTADACPPCLLLEGWAQAKSGMTSAELAADAWQARYEGESPWQLDALTASPWYSLDTGPVYSIGGALVDYLLREFGETKFLDLYSQTNGRTFAADFVRIYGRSLAQTEFALWQAIERLAPPENKRPRGWIDPDREDLSAKIDRALWREMAAGVNHSATRLHPIQRQHWRITTETEQPTEAGRLSSRQVNEIWWGEHGRWSRSTEPGVERVVADGKERFWLRRALAETTWQLENPDRLQGVAYDQSIASYFRMLERNDCQPWFSPRTLLSAREGARYEIVDLTAESVAGERRVTVDFQARTPNPSGAKSRIRLVLAPATGWQETAFETVDVDEPPRQGSTRCAIAWEPGDPPRLAETILEETDAAGKIAWRTTTRYEREPLGADVAAPFVLADFRLGWSWSDLHDLFGSVEGLARALCLASLAGAVLLRAWLAVR